MSTWSSLFAEALGEPGRTSGAVRVERLAVRPGEVAGRVRGPGVHEVSLIRTVVPEAEWERLCAALASQPVFRARVLAGELPVAAARVFSLLGWDLVPRGWDDLVATCSCDRWDSRCAHLAAAVAELGAEADRDPFALTRWLGRERRALMAQVRAFSTTAAKGPSGEEATFGENGDASAFEIGTESPSPPDAAAPSSAAAFWAAPSLPDPPSPPDGAGERVRAAAPGVMADDLPGFGHPRPGL
ncbi:hypothetical protein A6A08_17320 [Nocardiopsis sp. TSRI0078]|uniref:SWIM zinc finger family protein n=1 Tax=unclassified Nocardiopsis TaxID=2649073 RepID=UPI00093D5EC2|nr:hypothetical protein [Nocardiopsis sp. TSRI0078]OKI12324.1 hypothetical protein A6A08_17320 [Nocardiopsis sp. TSRI0078]